MSLTTIKLNTITGEIDWESIVDEPTEFPPASHTQSADTITDGTTKKSYLTSERIKLTGIEEGATANSTDAQLRDRATHTGTQSADTIVNGTTNKVFTAAEQDKLTNLANGAANVDWAEQWNYFNATVGQSSFAISGGYTVGTIKQVNVGGVGPIQGFTATDGVNVVLDTAIVANDIIAPDTTVEVAILIGYPVAGVHSLDERYFNRANHTGTQAISTITGLQDALDSAGVGDTNADDIIDGTVNRLFTDTEKTKLAGIAVGATANSTDASLRNRSTHTGTQEADTIVGLPAALASMHDASLLFGDIDPARLPAIPGTSQIISSGNLTALTSGQQSDIALGSLVTTTDGKRWVYTGTGTKTLEASYIQIGDVTPDWSTIASKPTEFTASSASVLGMVLAGLSTASAVTVVNTDTILAGIGKLQAQVAQRLPLTGGTLTGTTVIDGGAGAPIFSLKGLAGQSKALRFYTGDILRWQISSSSSTESGSNVGSNLVVAAYADDGSTIGNAVVINRATRAVDFSGDVTVTRSGDTKLELLATDASAAQLRLRNSTGGYEWSINAAGQLALGNYNTSNVLENTPFTFSPSAGFAFGSNAVISHSGTPVIRLASASGTVGTNAVLSLDPSGNGFNVRDAQVRGVNVGTLTQVALEFYTSNAGTPTKQLTISPTGVADFRLRPTFNGSPLATQAEAAAGGGGSGVTSFNGRTGSVSPASNDYDSTEISHSSGSVSTALTTLAQKTPVIFTPEMYGAVGDGNTDDSNAFDAMMAAITSNGPTLVILSKRYYLSRQWQINKNGIRVVGHGAMDYVSSRGTAIIFKNNNFDGIMIGTNVDGDFVYGVELSYFQVVFNTCTDSTRFAVVVAGAAHVRLLRTRLLGSSNNSTGQCNGLWFRDGQSLTLDEVYMVGFTAEYVLLQSGALQINNPGGDQRWIYGGRRPDVLVAYASRFAAVSGNTRTQAVRIAGAAVAFGSSMFRDCTTVFCKNHYVMEKESGSTTSGTPSFLYIMGKGGEAASSDYIKLVHGYHFMMDGSYFGTADDTDESGGSGLVVEETFGGPVIVTGSYMKATAKHVVHIKGGRDITLVGNTFGRAGVGSSQVYSNIRVEPAASEIIINSNNLTNLVPATSEPYSSTRYGIDCTSNDYVMIVGNRCRGGLGDIRYRTGSNVQVGNNLGSVTTFT